MLPTLGKKVGEWKCRQTNGSRLGRGKLCKEGLSAQRFLCLCIQEAADIRSRPLCTITERQKARESKKPGRFAKGSKNR
jgi:hypothetical protein